MANIDTSLTTVSIFEIYGPEGQCLYDSDNDFATAHDQEERCIVSMCQLGHNMLATGYCLHSSFVVFTLSIGSGVFAFTLDLAYGEFLLKHEDIKIPRTGRIYSFNKGPNGKPYTGSYIECLVGEIHWMLLVGGVYGNLKNANSKEGNLRLLYECAPMSFLIEQAGGKATNSVRRILDIEPKKRTPIFIGSPDEIDKLQSSLA